MNQTTKYMVGFFVVAGSLLLIAVSFYGQEKRESSYSPSTRNRLKRLWTTTRPEGCDDETTI
jgi:hypothetical protein